MALARKLFINLDTRKRQLSDASVSQDSVERLTFWKYERVPLEIVLVERDREKGPNDFTRVDVTGVALKVAINDVLDDGTPLAEQVLTADSSQNRWTGTLVLSNALINTYIGSADKTPYFEIEITDGTNRLKALVEVCNLKVPVLQETTVSPDPSKVYLTFQEQEGIFVKQRMDRGQTITIPSEDGKTERIIGANNNGTAQDDMISV